jgi:hypothetical protein
VHPLRHRRPADRRQVDPVHALTKAGIAAANFPFCTIEPNTGVVPVPDPRLNALAEIVKPQKVIPTSFEFVDIAGLVAGASRARGLGNKFLAHIREVDAIAHVVRCFEHATSSTVSGKGRPDRRHRDIDLSWPWRTWIRWKSRSTAPNVKPRPATRTPSSARTC